METTPYDLCIVGAGLSGLALATFLHNAQPELRLLVLEQAARAGGTIESFASSGYLGECGPHGFLDNCEESKKLIHLAGLRQELQLAPLSRFGRYLCLGGKLQLIPQSPGKIIRAPLLSWREKGRILGELIKSPLPGEPSVAQWVRHRFGEALLPFADAAFTGTYAGDINRLKIDAVMPGLRALEQRHGSVLRGMLKKIYAARRAGKPHAGLPAMTNFRHGMVMLPQYLAAKLVERSQLVLNNGVERLQRNQEGWRLTTRQGRVDCRRLVLALPSSQSLVLLRPVLTALPPPEVEVPLAQIATVLLGFDDRARIPFGFGYLAPAQERRFALGALFSSHMFPSRAPKGCQMVEAIVGGRRSPAHLELDDQELQERVYQDLCQLMSLPEPRFSAVLRPRSGIPQFEEGYTHLLRWREQIHADGMGCGGTGLRLGLCGFGWGGIGVNDMVKEASKLAQAILAGTRTTGQYTELKGIYL